MSKGLAGAAKVTLIFIILISILFIYNFIKPTNAFESSPTVWTADPNGKNKTDFSPEENVYILGENFLANANVNIYVTRPNGVIDSGSETTDPYGAFEYEYTLDGITGIYDVFTTDGINSVSITFNDSSGSTWTTRNDCGDEQQDVNHFSAGEHVYINGAGFSSGSYSWSIKGTPGSCDSNIVVASGTVHVSSSGKFCFDAYTVLVGDCGVYQTKVGTKGDNYQVGDWCNKQATEKKCDDAGCLWCQQCKYDVSTTKTNEWLAGACVLPGTDCGWHCEKGYCGATCSNGLDCSCPKDACVGLDYYDYPSNGTCADCTTSCYCRNGTSAGQPCHPSIIGNDPRCGECQKDDDCNKLDKDYCDGTVIKHDEGKCTDHFCKAETTVVQDCNDGLYCNGQETCLNAVCVQGTPLDCSGNDTSGIATCFNVPDNKDFTWDFRNPFTSICDEATDSCTTGDDTITHTCSVDNCGAECDGQNLCQNKCVGNVRNYGGACQGDCTCSYQTENCDNLDDWYNTSNTQWINTDQCTEKEQLQQEYRDYTCDKPSVKCDYSITDNQWIDTGSVRNKPDDTVCGDAPFGACDVQDTCSSGVCTDNVMVIGTECRASEGACDLAEVCDGASHFCPADEYLPGTVQCRASADICDKAEMCTGSSALCPANGFLPGSTECRASAGACDVADFCTGSDASCPTDVKSTSLCRPSAGICDVPESCDGINNNCPADSFLPASTVCRASSGNCDVAELCTGSSANCPVDESGPNLFLSEYIEGTGLNKALEIYNPTASGIDLTGYKIEAYHNGAVTPTFIIALPPTTLASSDVFIVCNGAIDPSVLPLCDLISGNIQFNGDDAVVLKNSAGAMLDVIGQIGFDPGTEWGTGLTSTADNTLVRKCDVACGDMNGADIFDTAIQWYGYATNTFSYLGSHNTVCCGNGQLDSGEQCESPFDTCCDSGTCQFKPSDIECRASAGVCDVEEMCTGLDAACPTDTFASAGTPCYDVLYCNGLETCDGSGHCQSGTPVDCSGNDTSGIETCDNNPDNIHFTWDFRNPFTSVCDEVKDICTTGDDTITHTCDYVQCDAECDSTHSCDNKCVGDTRYFSGSCNSKCNCDYSTEDCSLKNGWYNTTNTQWVSVSRCTEKEQLQQEYRDYTCSDSACDYSITDNQWIDTGNTRNKSVIPSLNPPNKTVGDPKSECQQGEWCEWKITILTSITLSCEEGKIKWRYALDGDWKDWNIDGSSVTIYFPEESNHTLEAYCIDDCGNSTADIENFKVEGTAFEIPLNKKWNLISVPFVLLDDSPSEVFKNISNNIVSVWSYGNGQWYTWTPGVGGTLTSIKPGWGYWVLAKDDSDLLIAGSLMSPVTTPPSKNLQSGWNLIGYYGTDWQTYRIESDNCGYDSYKYGNYVYCSLNSLIDTQEGFPRWSSMWGYDNCGNDNATWHQLESCVGDYWSINKMFAGKGYWIEMDVPDGYSPASNCMWNKEFKCSVPII